MVKEIFIASRHETERICVHQVSSHMIYCYMVSSSVPWGVCQACRRVAVHYVFARCVPGVHQACVCQVCVGTLTFH